MAHTRAGECRGEFGIRPWRPADCLAAAAVYRAAILVPEDPAYSPAQRRAWAGFTEDVPAFLGWLSTGTTLVAEVNQATVVGFGNVRADGFVGALFVAPEWQRRGLGSALLGALLEQGEAGGVREFTTAASVYSRPLFERHGFRKVGTEYTAFGGEPFARCRMRRAA